MTNERMKNLLINCVNSIAYDNDMTKEQLLEIIGFTPKELAELGFDWYEDADANQYWVVFPEASFLNNGFDTEDEAQEYADMWEDSEAYGELEYEIIYNHDIKEEIK